MKKIFILNYSEDGVGLLTFTNVKKLFIHLSNGDSYIPKDIASIGSENNLKFNYANLLKSINEAKLKNRFWMCTLNCTCGHSVIDIYECSIVR